MNKFLTSVFLLFFLSGFVATAGAVTVYDNITDDLFIDNQVISGSFNINPPALPSDGSYNAPYDINSAKATFTFADDVDVASFSYGTTTNRWQYKDTHNGDRYFYQTLNAYFVDENEVVELSVGNQVANDGTTWFESQPELAGQMNLVSRMY